MTLVTIIKTFGYPAIIIGTFLEGEVILVLAGLAAHLGYLELPYVIASGFLGTFAGDQLYFHLGKYYSDPVLKRFPRWKSKLSIVKRLIERYRVLFILGFRFTYGLRTVSPFAIGMSRVPVLLYMLLNGVSALAWATLVGGGGYFLGNAMRKFIGDVKYAEIAIMGVLVVAGGVIWIIKIRRDKRKYGKPALRQ
jgi:membrane protein DedA with SNARE-associated domain